MKGYRMTKCIHLLLLLCLCGVAAFAVPLADPIAITSGPITGVVADGVHVYKGVPYARPPVGALRWRAPQPPDPWTAPRAMTAFGPICPQGDDGLGRKEQPQPQREDCLYLNVWTPARDADDRLPVMAWIHGGGLVTGAGSKAVYDGARLAKQGVVVVTLNYRLGPFGFFVHPDLAKESPDGAAGNYGLLDQIAALQWVRANIARFGGDPGNVTIFGESAGALSVLTLMTAKPAQGLFQRAIAESGGAPARVQIRAAAEALWRTKAAGIGVTDWAGGLATLRAKPAAEILAMYRNIGPLPGSSGKEMLCLDGTVLTQSPADVFAAGNETAVPLLIGSNTDEGTIFTLQSAPKTTAAYEAALRAYFPGQVDAILRLYPAKTDADAAAAYTAALGDVTFTAGARRLAVRHAAAGQPTYRYVFGRVTRVAGALGFGAFHGAEVPYVFGNVDGLQYRADDTRLAATISANWVAFARTGKPASNAWQPYDPQRDNYLYFDTTISAMEGYRTAACDLWDKVLGEQ